MDLLSLVPFALIGIIFYFLIFRPQAAKQKEHDAMLAALKIGQHIMLDSGIYAKIIKVIDADLVVEIADGVKVKVVKKAVLRVL